MLTSDEMLESDVAAARDDRRVAEGFISPADARAFLELARRGGAGDGPDAITRAYFRGLPGTPVEPGPAGATGNDATLAAGAEVTALAGRTHLIAPLFEQAMSELRQRDPGRFAARVREVGYLVNVWITGGAHEGRRPRPVEALELVLRTCEAGLRTQLAPERVDREQTLAVLARTPADLLFRRGFRHAGVPVSGDKR